MGSSRIFSLYWDNIDPAIVSAQKSVFDKLQMPVSQHRIDGLNHGEWMDWLMNRTEVDVFLFIDIDCIPLNRNRMLENMSKSASGTLVGAEGVANHLDPNRTYAAAWYVYISRQAWEAYGRPSAKDYQVRQNGHDTCQLWTDVWRRNNAPVELISPTGCVVPKWDLPGRKQCYGPGTTYGDDCYHLFESRKQENIRLFVERCREVTPL